jgi:ribonucleoside-triphosphate reductase
MYPDYISAKKMRETYEGNVFAPMGCSSFLSPWKDEN